VLTVGGVHYPKGFGMHPAGEVAVALGGACGRFTAVVGVDAETAGLGSVVFSVIGDGVTLYTSPVLVAATTPVLIDVDITGRGTLRLVVGGRNRRSGIRPRRLGRRPPALLINDTVGMSAGTLINVLELVGLYVFATSGALMAISKRFDVVGILVLALLTALGVGCSVT
jgi:hypothetical protein